MPAGLHLRVKPGEGFEPPTSSLRNWHSATELPGLIVSVIVYFYRFLRIDFLLNCFIQFTKYNIIWQCFKRPVSYQHYLNSRLEAFCYEFYKLNLCKDIN